MSQLVLASVRTEVADYLYWLVRVYALAIVLYIVLQLAFSFGFRPGYHRWVDAIMGFLRDVSEPYLRIFRRFLPAVGGLDFSPIVAILLLYIVGSVVHNAIHG